jgi:hypothetical protein
MLLVIFGAGASYDSVPHLPAPSSPVRFSARNAVFPYEYNRPPLANQLFDDRPDFVTAMTRFRECIALVPLLRKPGIVVERELAKVQEQAVTFPPAHRELAAIRYYIHFALWECQKKWTLDHRGITNYATLLREIERWRFRNKERVCFVTFNYDTMLEQAIEQVLGWSFTDFSQYVSFENYVLVKLHGSIDWGWELDAKPNNPNEVIASAADLKVTDRYRRVARHPMVFDDGSVGFPALSIPVEKKDQFACPREHVEALATAIPEVKKIITIGWRATELGFLKILKARIGGLRGNPDLMIVSGDKDGANETLNHLGIQIVGSGQKHVIGQSGFTGVINDLGLLEKFLA